MDNLQQVQEKVFEKKRLEAKLSVLRSQNRSLELRVAELKRELESQQEDVLRLERVSLSAIFYGLIGKKDERLDKEKAEAYGAKLKYDTAALEQKQVCSQIQDMKNSCGNWQVLKINIPSCCRRKPSKSAIPERLRQRNFWSWKGELLKNSPKRRKSVKPFLQAIRL